MKKEDCYPAATRVVLTQQMTFQEVQDEDDIRQHIWEPLDGMPEDEIYTIIDHIAAEISDSHKVVIPPMDQERFNALCKEVIDNIVDGEIITKAVVEERNDRLLSLKLTAYEIVDNYTISYLNETVVLVDGMRVEYCASAVRVFIRGLAVS